jgi:hypothetical protein
VDSTSKIVVWDFSNKSKESMEIEYNDKTWRRNTLFVESYL